MDCLARLVIRIDFDHREVAILPKAPEDSGVPFNLGLSPFGIPTLPVNIRGHGRRVFSLDTGSQGNGDVESHLLDSLLEKGIAYDAGKALSLTVLKTEESRSARISEITLGDFSHRGLLFGESATNTLGVGYLSRFVMTFDFPRMRVYLKPSMRFAEPDRKNLTGAAVWRPEGVTTVYDVKSGSAADLAGLKAGDVVEQFDGKEAASLSLMAIHKSFCVPGRHTLRVTRGKEALEVVVVLTEHQDVSPNP
ncbi:MAG TPA: PDZ domain-containing protein [Pirellulales bacterium]|nr:PDZ domain-containing protein [Pirellulales bacterium]